MPVEKKMDKPQQTLMRYIVLIYNVVKKNLKNCKNLQGNAMDEPPSFARRSRRLRRANDQASSHFTSLTRGLPSMKLRMFSRVTRAIL